MDTFSLPDFENQILFEDLDLIILNKKPLQLVQSDKQKSASLEEFLQLYLQKKKQPVFCGLVHRLDRPVSGLVLFAKNPETLASLNTQIKEHEIEKYYWAIVQNLPPKKEDLLSDFLVKDEAKNKSFVAAAKQNHAKEAQLTYKVIAHSDRYYLLEIQLLTGRHHQIRAQMANIKCPIKGDLKYGAKRSNRDGSICLHARKIAFIHPKTKKHLVFEAPAPQDALWQFFEKQLFITLNSTSALSR